MSKHMKMNLVDSTDDEDGEEYFSTDVEHSHIAPRGKQPLGKAANRMDDEDSVKVVVPLHEELQNDDAEDQPRSLSEMGWIRRDEPENPNTPISAYLNAFFMMIATVLGTGILALPVKLAHSGFTPLLVTYTLIFVMQSALVIFLVEVLQRARVEFQKRKVEEGSRMDDLPLVSSNEAIAPEDAVEGEEDQEVELDVEDYESQGSRKAETEHSKGEDLHSLAKMYLPRILCYLFDGAITMHFLSLLITYTLAASEGYGQLFGLHSHWIWLAIPFVGLLSNLVIFGSKYLETVISLFTFSKAGLLVLMVVITAVVSSTVHQDVVNSWKYIGRPFLIGTVALGGCYNILPVAFEKVRLHASQVKIFTAAALAGLSLVYLFNLGWCFFVLRIVPQLPVPGEPPYKEGDPVLTLWDAERNGQISTVPLVNIIRRDAPKFKWIAVIVMIFTIVSITVSFIVNSMGWKHYVEGYVQTTFAPTKQTSNHFLKRFWIQFKNLPLNWKRGILFGGSFTLILAVALFNPKSFLKIMEKVTSLAANGTAAGVCWMLHTSRAISPVIIPWALPNWIYNLRIPVTIFFVGAMVYNVVSTIAEAAGVMWL